MQIPPGILKSFRGPKNLPGRICRSREEFGGIEFSRPAEFLPRPAALSRCNGLPQRMCTRVRVPEDGLGGRRRAGVNVRPSHRVAEEFGWGVNFVRWSRWESTGDIGRHRETQIAGVGKGWSSREAPGAQHWKTLGVVEAVVVYSPTNHLSYTW